MIMTEYRIVRLPLSDDDAVKMYGVYSRELDAGATRGDATSRCIAWVSVPVSSNDVIIKGISDNEIGYLEWDAIKCAYITEYREEMDAKDAEIERLNTLVGALRSGSVSHVVTGRSGNTPHRVIAGAAS